MSVITTSEELQKLLTIIFGYVGERTTIPAGAVLGPSKATKSLVRDLTERVLEFLQAFNGMLRDFAGAEIFSIEFALRNLKEDTIKTRLYPKSMIFIPGKWKENQCLLVALKHEIGMLDPAKARRTMDHICRRYDEIEEVINRPELNEDQKRALLGQFATYFAEYLQGKLVEGRWDRKLVGLKEEGTNRPRHEVCSVVMRRQITWRSPTPTISTENPKFVQAKPPLDDEAKLEHFKFAMSPQGAYFIAQQTFRLAAKLLELANIGSVNEIQQGVIELFLSYLQRVMGKSQEVVEPSSAIEQFKNHLSKFKGVAEEFRQVASAFTQEGLRDTLENMAIALVKFVGDHESQNKTMLRKILDVFISWSKETAAEDSREIRSSDLRSELDYFGEVVGVSLDLLERHVESYVAKHIQEQLLDQLVEILKNELERESKSTRALGMRFLEKFREFLSDKLEEKFLFAKDVVDLDLESVEEDFFSMVRQDLDVFLKSVPISITDLVGFAEDLVEIDVATISQHLERFKKFEAEATRMYNLMLRYSSFNRFVRENADQIFDPESLTNLFYEFTRKRLGAMEFTWLAYGLSWIQAFREKYQQKFLEDLENGLQWPASHVIELFLGHMDEIGEKIHSFDHFVEVVDHYVGNLPPRPEKPALVEYLKTLESTVGITNAFPNYLKKMILKAAEQKVARFVAGATWSYFVADGPEGSEFFQYLVKHHLRYYSQLLAEPSTLTLVSTDYRADGDLYYKMDFSYQRTRTKVAVTSNWYDVRRQF